MQFNVHAHTRTGHWQFCCEMHASDMEGAVESLKKFLAPFASIGCRLTESRENFNSVTVNVNNTAVKYTIDEKKD